MAYRFNPPPNWPVSEPGWTPPPGWQPDPSWGPVPEGWNFWVPEEETPAAPREDPATQEKAAAPEAAPKSESAPASDAAESPAPPAPAATNPDGAVGADGAELTGGPAVGDAAAAEAPMVGPADPVMPVPASTDHMAPAPSDQPLASSDEFSAPSAESSAPSAQPSAPSEQSPAPSAQSYGYGETPAGHEHSGAHAAPADPAGAGTDDAAPEHIAPTHAVGGTSQPTGAAGPAAWQSAQAPAPSGANGQAYNASAGAHAPQKKGVLARFWWLGCLILALLLIIALIIGGLMWWNRDDDTKAAGATSSAVTTESPSGGRTGSPTASGTLSSQTPSIDPKARTIPLTLQDGKGSLQVQMAWVKPGDLKGTSGSAIEAPTKGPLYLQAVVHVKVTEGTMSLNPPQFAVVTPYGGEIEPATATFGLASGGVVGNSRGDKFSAGEEYTIAILYDVPRHSGLKLRYTAYDQNHADWDVPA